MELTEQDKKELLDMGIDPSTVSIVDPEMSSGQAVAATAKRHAGSWLGGGAGVAAGIALAPETFGGSLLLPIIGGLVGGYGGQKLQDVILPDDTTKELEQQAKLAQERHPYISLGTDIVGSSLLSGGKPSLSNLSKAGRAILSKDILSEADQLALNQIGREALSPEGISTLTRKAENSTALKNVLLGAGINPAIDVGASLVTEGKLPSLGQLAADTVGGAVFSDSSKLGKLMHRGFTTPTEETTVKIPTEESFGSDRYFEIPIEEKQNLIDLVKEETPTTTTKLSDLISQEKSAITEAGETAEDLNKQLIESGDVSYSRREEELPKTAKASESIELPNNNNPIVGEQTTQSAKMIPRATVENGYTVTVQHPSGVPGDKGYVQVDEFRSGKNIRSSNPETLRNEGLDIPTTEELMKLPMGRYDLKDVVANKVNHYSGEGMPEFISKGTHENLISDFQQRTATTGTVLQHIANDKNNGFQSLAKHILNVADKESLNVKWSNSSDRSSYSPSFDRVNIRNFDLSDTRVLMEEAIHSITSKKIRMFRGLQGAELKNKIETYTKNGDNEAVKSIAKAYLKTAEQLGYSEMMFKDSVDEFGDVTKGLAGNADAMDREFSKTSGHGIVPYAMGNLDEFIAHAFKSEQFQHLLNEIPSDIEGKTVWQTIMDAVKRLLGFDVKQGSMLEHVLNKSTDLMTQDRPSKTRFSNKETRTSLSEDISARPADIRERDTSKKGFFRGLEATFDKVDRDSRMLGDAGRNWQSRRDEFLGMKNVTLQDLEKFDRPTIDKVTNLHREAYRHNTPLPQLSDKEQQISKILSDYYGKIADIRKNAGLEIDGRAPGKNIYYVPDQLNDRTLNLFTEKPLSPEAIHAENVWVDYVFKESGGKRSKDEIRKDIQDYITALGGKNNNYTSVKFGAIRRSAGYGLPEGLRETDTIKSLDKYGSRAAADLAMLTELETKPVIAASLKLNDPNTGQLATHPDAEPRLAASKNIQNMMKWVTDSVTGTMAKNTPKINATVRVVNNAILGTATGIRDTLQMPTFAIPYINKFSDLQAALKGIINFRNESRNALKTGARQPSVDKIQMGQILESPDRYSALMNKVATGLRKYQGREMLENLNRDITFSVGKELARQNVIGAKAGDAKSLKFLERFGTLVPDNIVNLQGSELEEALNRVAKNFTDANQGTYGGAGLPVGIIESQFAPFLALQKWSVEKSNVIYKDVVKPFLTGENHLPLITYTLSSILTGAAIQKINELMTGRKSQDPTVEEALSNGSAKNIVGELATIMQLSSLGGIIGDSLKFISDPVLYHKLPRNIVSFPTFTMASDMSSKTSDMLEALQNGENPWEVWKAYSMDMFIHNVQLLRAVANHTVSKEDIERSDKFRDLRVFNQLEGRQQQEIPDTNKYLGLDAKDFKRSDNLQDAMAQLPGLLEKAIADANGDPYELLSKLRSLKNNSYQIFPSLETMPIRTMRYYQHLANTQGSDVAAQRLQEFLTQSELNKIKSSMIP